MYLFWLTVSNMCALITAIPLFSRLLFFHGSSYGLGGGSYITALYQVTTLTIFINHDGLVQAHIELPLTNSFCVSSVYIIIYITVNRYIAIYKPFALKKIHTLRNARLCISLCFFCSVLLHIPFSFRNKVVFKGSCSNLSDTSISFNETGVNDHSDCGWQSEKNIAIADTDVFKAYLVASQILERIGPIVVLAILNTLIVLKFLRIAQELEVPGAGVLRKNRQG